MKAMILGATGYLENGLSMVNGLRNLGIESGFFGYRTFLEKYGRDELRNAIFGLLKTHKPEWVFCQYQHNQLIPAEWFGEIKAMYPDIKISLMSVDMRNHLDIATLAAGKHADVCFQKGRQKLYQDRGLNCQILQEGYTDLLFHRKDNISKEFDLVFAGGFYPGREFPATQERVNALGFLCRKFDMRVFGTGWERILPQKNVGGFIELPQVNDVYNASKVVLNINHYNDIEHYWSIRMIEGMASGSMMLTKYVPGLEKYFSNFKELVWFYSLSDCIALLEHYLNNEAEREAIAIQGSMTVQKAFRWEAIMEKAYGMVFPKEGCGT
jgi:spore maturation protein CgeB